MVGRGGITESAFMGVPVPLAQSGCSLLCGRMVFAINHSIHLSFCSLQHGVDALVCSVGGKAAVSSLVNRLIGLCAIFWRVTANH